jgi:hypothetical protein
MTPDFRALLAGAKLPEKTLPVCLRGDLTAEFERLDRALTEAQRNEPDSLAGNGTGDLVDQIEAVREQMREHTYDFRLRALPKPRFRALIGDHPPRRGDGGEILETDRVFGLNTDTFFDALIRACVVDPQLDDQTWAQLEPVLTDRQYDQLATASWDVNRSDVDVPFSLAASRISRNSGAGSKPRTTSESPRRSSTDAKRRTAPTTSTTSADA